MSIWLIVAVALVAWTILAALVVLTLGLGRAAANGDKARDDDARLTAEDVAWLTRQGGPRA